jgi:flagellar hook assembly protein FlgD/outer membrane protein OmpA-like peptidoglycan-associated protein
MRMRTVASAVFLCILATAAFAQYSPPAGSSVLEQLYSPLFLAGGASLVSDSSPAADVLNPAASGAKQRLTFDLNSTALFGTLESDEGFDLSLNGGVTAPTRVGVFSGSLHAINANFQNVDLGTLLGLNVSFAKDLYPKLLVGVGLGAQYGGSDWGLAADLGFIHLPGDVGFMKDLRWGVALRGLGKAVDPDGAGPITGLPDPFTLAGGLAFDVIQTENVVWSFNSDVALPSFQNLRFDLGTQLALYDRVFLYLSTGFDLHEIAVGNGRPVPLGFGASVKIGTSVSRDKSELKTTLAAAPLQSGIWAVGLDANLPVGMRDKNPPAIELQTDQQYISPNHDGVQDELVRSLKITDERDIKGYRFVVLDSSGAKVREIVNKDERPENVTVKNVFSRLAYVRRGITVPPQLQWDGRTDQGGTAPDGAYTYYVESWDDNGNVGRSKTGTVIVDDTPPTAELKAAYLVFSPNGDGNKDTLPLEISGSQEVDWKGSMQHSQGEEVKGYEWKDSSPQSFEWDGKNAQGLLVPDGVYSFRLGATDLAGNSFSTKLDNIIVSTLATPINITISDSYLSPNEDGIKDTVVFELHVPVTSGIEKWTLSVVNATGETRRTFSGTQDLPAEVVFDGKDDKGKVLPEGTYVGKLEVLYVNGNNPKAGSPPLVIDLTAPSASASADLTIFSPDGDGNKDTVTIYQETSEEQLWNGAIEDIEGKTVRSFSWRGVADPKFQWDGRTDAGKLAPDGIYLYSVKATDRAGNSGESRRIRIELNTEATEVFVSADSDVFSPNADGVKDTLTIRPRLKVSEGVASYALRILDKSGQAVRSLQAQNRAPEDFVWDGLDNRGRRVPDGVYTAELSLEYQKGDRHLVKTGPFTVDTQAPTIEASAEYGLFSPDGDGNRDFLPIEQKSSNEQLWEGAILNSKGQTVRSYYWKGQAASLRWDGKDENGNKIPDGQYSYRVKGTDRAGNTVVREIKGIVMDTRQTAAFLTVSSDGFSPNGDKVADTIDFTPVVTLAEGIQSWTLQMVNAEAGVQKSFTGAPPVPARISWDGKSDSGSIAREGTYQALLRVDYLKGNRPQAQSAQFRLDVTAPQVEVSLTPQPFSPDNDGVDDEVTIGLKVKDISPIADWGIRIDDPEAHPFVEFVGKGMPSERIIWNGLSDSGELVQAASDYMLHFTIKDELGNARTVNKLIAVDVLVIREGDKLKIRIPSITFPPNSPDLSKVTEPEKAEKNDWVLKRLAQILTKYSAYDFRIEGHANEIFWDNPAKAALEEKEELLPLSLARAEAVKAALVSLGLKADRISVAGLGGSSPVVPFSDAENRWKNRRVEFILLKK